MLKEVIFDLPQDSNLQHRCNIYMQQTFIYLYITVHVYIYKVLLWFRWSNLKALAKERRSLLDKALEKAQQFHDRWKKESDWLTEAERGAYADWTPHGLPETCAAEITEHEVHNME